jgi:hypothetical protein
MAWHSCPHFLSMSTASSQPVAMQRVRLTSSRGFTGSRPKMRRCFCRVGRYHDAVLVNFAAYSADAEAARTCLQSYIPEHNMQMLLFAASMAGQYAGAQYPASIIFDPPAALFFHEWHAAAARCFWVQYPSIGPPTGAVCQMRCKRCLLSVVLVASCSWNCGAQLPCDGRKRTELEPKHTEGITLCGRAGWLSRG